MTITLNGRDWSVDDFRDYRRNQPKAPDPAEVPAFPDGIFGDLLAELDENTQAAANAAADALAAQEAATIATSSALTAAADAAAAEAARLAADAAAAAAQAAVGGVRVTATDTTAGPLAAKLVIVGGAVEVVNPGAGEVLRVSLGPVDALSANLALLAMRQVVAEGWSVTGMIDGVVDEFTDQTGLDAGASSGMIVTGGYVTGGAYGYADVSAGKTYYTNVGGSPTPGAAFDENTGGAGAWSDNAAATTNRWLAVDLGVAMTIGRVRLYNHATYTVKNFRVEYSSDTTNGWNGTWTTVHTGLNPSGTAWQAYDFSPVSARWWRLYALDSHGWLGLAEAEICEATIVAGGGAFTAVSAAYQPSDPLALPAAARLVLRHQPIGAVVLGTDLIIEASRDGGATWTAGMPVREATIAGIDILMATVALSAQPAGQSMRWRVRTTAVEQRLHAISMHW